ERIHLLGHLDDGSLESRDLLIPVANHGLETCNSCLQAGDLAGESGIARTQIREPLSVGVQSALHSCDPGKHSIALGWLDRFPMLNAEAQSRQALLEGRHVAELILYFIECPRDILDVLPLKLVESALLIELLLQRMGIDRWP
ncbi:MAG: hypothetical protein ACRD3J_07360, partial [Thermoanaerobaculia bacterium]